MGGAAGHLSHIHEDLDLTFGEIKSMLRDVASADIKAVEKVDGQNIFFTWDAKSGEVRTARNISDIKKGGMTPQEYEQKWKGHPAAAPFMNGFAAITEAMNQLSHDDKIAIFGTSGSNYINAEIMYVSHPNIIKYDSNYIVLHSLKSFDDNNIDMEEARRRFQKLVSILANTQHKVKNDTWNIAGPTWAALKNIMDQGHYQNLVDRLDQLGMSDNATIGDYVEEQLRSGLIGNMNIPVNKQEGLISIILGKDNAPSLRELQKNEPDPVKKQMSAIATQANIYAVIATITRPIEQIISDFAIEVLRGLESFFIADNDKAIQNMRQELKQSIQYIQNSLSISPENIVKTFERNLKKLGDIEKIASSAEGVIFEYPPGSHKLYKLTGAFSMVNQIIGLARRLPKSVTENLSHITYITHLLRENGRDLDVSMIERIVEKYLERKLQDKINYYISRSPLSYNNDDFYKATASVWRQLMKVYAEDQYRFARQYSKSNIPISKYRPL